MTYTNAENLMFVVGATKAEYLTEIRKIVPDNFLLVPTASTDRIGSSHVQQAFVVRAIGGGRGLVLSGRFTGGRVRVDQEAATAVSVSI